MTTDLSKLDGLERLARLRDSGALTQDEFLTAKAELLAGPETGQQGDHRRRLHVILAVLGIAIVIGIGAVFWHRSHVKSVPESDLTEQNPTDEGQAEMKAEPLTSLDSILKFSKNCELGPLLEKIHGGMLDSNPIDIPGFGSVQPTVRRWRNDEGGINYTSSLPLRGRWHGLKVSRLFEEGLEQTDGVSFQIRFLEDPAHVRTVLNNLGFDLPSVGKFREIPSEDGNSVIGVRAVTGGASLAC